MGNRASITGLGSKSCSLAVCLANRPPLDEYQTLRGMRAMGPGEIAHIATATGNHWRKIFNVYAKLAFKLDSEGYGSWQALRDQSLLQPGSPYGLLFTAPPVASIPSDSKCIYIVAGKQYAQSLGLAEAAVWIDQHFAVNHHQRYILSPYFDYRALSDARIDRLVALMAPFTRG